MGNLNEENKAVFQIENIQKQNIVIFFICPAIYLDKE